MGIQGFMQPSHRCLRLFSSLCANCGTLALVLWTAKPSNSTNML
jgi:hypothetical protein